MSDPRPGLTKRALVTLLDRLPDDAAVLIENPANGCLHDPKAYVVEEQGPSGPAFLCMELRPDDWRERN